MIDFLASERHFIDHLVPVWFALPAELRGTFLSCEAPVLAHLAAHGIEGVHLRPGMETADTGRSHAPRATVVAAVRDLIQGRRDGRSVFARVEHGVGQSYIGDRDLAYHRSYSGGKEHEDVSLFLQPNEQSAARWRESYPDAEVHVIGATRVLPPPQEGEPTVAVSFHWPGVQPELKSAWDHFRLAVVKLSREVKVIGHCHPRVERMRRPWFEGQGIEFVRDIEDVARRAHVYVVDNSSSLYEMAVHRPVLALDAPQYRRDVHHGLRFWDLIPGPHIGKPEELAASVAHLLDGETRAERVHRESVVAQVIPYHDGADRAARLLAAWSVRSLEVAA